MDFFSIQSALLNILLLLALLVAPTLVQGRELSQTSEKAIGTVFEDLNQNGLQDAHEPGVAGASVSNGRDVVVTDSQGQYRIRLAPGQILFISQPSGYTVSVDEHQLPQFYYTHYPDGSPTTIEGQTVDWLFPVMEPTGPLPERIDFPLHKLPEQETRFRAHAFADTQAKTDIDQDMLREDLVNTLLGNPYGAKFTLTVGDVVFDNLDLYNRHKKMMGLIGIPQWMVPGNHDVNFESPNDTWANETYKKHFGPTYYSFNVGNVHVVALHNVEYFGAEYKKQNGRPYRGAISEDQLRWLEADLAAVPKDKLIVIATHIPLIAEATDGNTVITGPNTENFDALLTLLRPFRYVYGLAGHDTSNSWKVQVNHRHGWDGHPWIAHTLAEARGSGWDRGQRDLRGVSDAMMEDGNPNGFYLLKFNDRELVPEFIPFPFGSDANQRMRVTLDPELETIGADISIHRGRLRPGTKVVVNLFDGGVRDQVWFSLDHGKIQEMTYSIRTDPFRDRAVNRFRGTQQAFSDSKPSAHIWEFALPDQLDPGIHHIQVRSLDEFGQEQRGVFTFEIVDDSQ